MRLQLISLCIFSCVTVQRYHVACYNILAILPHSGKSHFLAFDPLLLELSRRGHNVTVYSAFPRKELHPNYKDVDIGHCLQDLLDWSINETTQISDIRYMINLFDLNPTLQDISNCQPLVELANTKEKYYDLLITQFWISDWVLGYAYKLDIPFIGITTSIIPLWISPRIGLPENPSYIRYGHIVSQDPRHMSILEKTKNVYSYLVALAVYKYYIYANANEIMYALFGKPFPSADDIARNTSLILMTSHFSINLVRPFVPAAVEIGGIIIDEVKPLPTDIEKFMNESKNGVVYFSMGSVLKSTSFSEQQRDAFLNAFSKLPMRVIWKWESNDLPSKPENVLISKWLPQRAILAHPKLRLFISHGGQSSTNQAVYEAVPVLGVPIFIDQIDNINSLIRHGKAEKLDLKDLSAVTILKKVNTLLQNSSYKINAKKLSAVYRDRPMTPLDTAVYWTEYVIRHKGAHHLRSSAVEMPWYQYFLVDVILVICLSMVTFILILYFILKIVISKFYHLLKVRPPLKSKIN